MFPAGTWTNSGNHRRSRSVWISLRSSSISRLRIRWSSDCIAAAPRTDEITPIHNTVSIHGPRPIYHMQTIPATTTTIPAMAGRYGHNLLPSPNRLSPSCTPQHAIPPFLSCTTRPPFTACGEPADLLTIRAAPCSETGNGTLPGSPGDLGPTQLSKAGIRDLLARWRCGWRTGRRPARRNRPRPGNRQARRERQSGSGRE